MWANSLSDYFISSQLVEWLADGFIDEGDLGFPAPANKKAKLDEDFFKTLRNKHQPVELGEVDKYSAECLGPTEDVLQFPIIKRLFIRHNLTLISLASVERLFSSGGQIFKPTRNRLSGVTFEILLFLKANAELHL